MNFQGYMGQKGQFETGELNQDTGYFMGQGRQEILATKLNKDGMERLVRS